jgi:hypothetical protein
MASDSEMILAPGSVTASAGPGNLSYLTGISFNFLKVQAESYRTTRPVFSNCAKTALLENWIKIITRMIRTNLLFSMAYCPLHRQLGKVL